jgi:hypothetical protein
MSKQQVGKFIREAKKRIEKVAQMAFSLSLPLSTVVRSGMPLGSSMEVVRQVTQIRLDIINFLVRASEKDADKAKTLERMLEITDKIIEDALEKLRIDLLTKQFEEHRQEEKGKK